MQTRTEDFGYGLMTEADAEDGFAAGVGADDVEQETGLARQSRAGGKQDFVVCFQFLEEKAVVSHDTDFCVEATEEMDEIVDKRIVVVDNNNFHKQEKGMSGGGRGAISYGRVGLNIREARFVLQVGFDVFVASAAHGEHDHVIGLEGAAGEEGEGVAAFESGDDAFKAGEFEGGTERFIIGDRQDGGTAGVGEVGKERADAGIVESGGDAVGFDHAAFGVLHDEGAAAVEDARATDVDGRGGATALYALPTGFSQDDAHAGRVEVVIDAAGGVGATADAGEEIVRIVAAFLCFELGFDFLADDALKACHEVGIRMRADRRTDDVERVGWMRRPVGDGSVDGILERATATPDGANVGAEHFHAFHVDVLAFHIDGSHIDHAGHAHQRAGGGSGHAVLSGSRLGDDACFSEGSREEDLSDGVVDFVRPGVV